MASYYPIPDEGGLFYDPVLRMGISWLDTQPSRPEPGPQGTEALIHAVAAVLAIAAARTRQAGNFMALRDAVDRAMGPMPSDAEGTPDPREEGLEELPAILDARPAHEAKRLTALRRRQA
ncbi:hypothetical protein [Falsiroseomonas tokyonensis]|uniref:Uncharacterized protein n=1 Tax=Falsiroseomonas tokyonensis TaxID=430521 RepID=A0ABV7BQU5_9PROT|nr:hypothetical protein [Falsiroseomonas tokyonensis]MBU8537976.1 hypothetical protein [Falsiroseomonas tokyonensis]